MIERLYPMTVILNHKGQSSFYGKLKGAVITGSEDGDQALGCRFDYENPEHRA